MLKIINGEIVNYQDGIEMELVPSLPVSPSSDKIYILPDFSMNYYDSSWHLLGGSDQILKGTTAPTDTNKLWLDTTNSSSPILKYYNSTSWISISGSSTGIDDTKLSTVTTYSSNKIASLINNQGDYITTYTYNGDGKINGYTITGDKTENVTYTYFTSGDNLGKIETETIIKDGKTLVNTFSYTNGEISGVVTTTN